MTTLALSPIWNGTQFFDANGNVLSGGQIYSYMAGSNSVQQTTYADGNQVTPNTNPIVLNGSGVIPTELWFLPGVVYHLVLTDSDGDIIQSVDNLYGSAQSTIPTTLAPIIS